MADYAWEVKLNTYLGVGGGIIYINNGAVLREVRKVGTSR